MRPQLFHGRDQLAHHVVGVERRGGEAQTPGLRLGGIPLDAGAALAQLLHQPGREVVEVEVGGNATLLGQTPGQPALQRGDDGLFRSGGGELDADPAARLQQGALEGSNVSPVETMVAMISAARQFEQQMKLLQTAETNDKTASQLLSMNG